MGGLSAAREYPVYSASARKPVCPARGLCGSSDLRHRTTSQGRRKDDRQRQLSARPCARDFVRVGAAGDNAGRASRAVGAGRARHAHARYRQRSTIETMFGNLKTKGFALESTRLTNPDKLCTLPAALGFCRGAIGENWRHNGTPVCHSYQNTRPPRVVAVRLTTQRRLRPIWHLIKASMKSPKLPNRQYYDAFS